LHQEKSSKFISLNSLAGSSFDFAMISSKAKLTRSRVMILLLSAIIFCCIISIDAAGGASGASVAYSSLMSGNRDAEVVAPQMPQEISSTSSQPDDAHLDIQTAPQDEIQFQEEEIEEEEEEEEEEEILVAAEEEQIQTGPPPGFEVVCDGDVCELRPVDEEQAETEASAEGDLESDGVPAASIGSALDSEHKVDSDEYNSDLCKEEDEGDNVDHSHSPGGETYRGHDHGGSGDEEEEDPEEAEERARQEAEALQEELDAYDGPYAAELKELVGQGWQLELALQALYDHKGDMAAATKVLEMQEREAIQAHFNQTVAKMVENGWDEEVARQALLTQWKKEEENALRAEGKLPPEEEKAGDTSATVTPSSNDSKADTKKEDTPKENKGPKEAKREDVIFEVTEADIQKVVLDSPVPVLLDVYADWCAPCRQLTPVLENAAVKAGGMFRLAKLNSDKNKAFSDMLGVEALPTVFGFHKGKIIDSFTGGLTAEEMQSFMIGVIMGQPANRTRTEHDKTPEQLEKLRFKVSLSAGMASMGSLKRERLAMLIDQCLEGLQDEVGDDVLECKASVDCMRKVVKNCVENPEVEKFRHLPTSNPTIMGRVLAFENATQILHLIGFRMAEDESEIALIHRNPAPLVIAEQRFAKWIALARKVTEANLEIPEDIHEKFDEILDAISSDDSEDEMPIKRELADGKSRIAVHLIDGSVVRKIFSAATTTLGDVLDFVKESDPSLESEDIKLLPQFPANAFDPDDPPFDSSLEELGYSPGASLLVQTLKTEEEQTRKTASGLKGFFKKTKQTDDEESELSSDDESDSEYSSDEDSTEDESDYYSDSESESESDSSSDSEEEPPAIPKKSSFAERAAARRKQKNSASLFGVDDGIVEKKDPKKQEYYGGSGTVFMYPSDSESESDEEDTGIQDEDDEDVLPGGQSDSDSDYSVTDSDYDDEYDSSEEEEEDS